MPSGTASSHPARRLRRRSATSSRPATGRSTSCFCCRARSAYLATRRPCRETRVRGARGGPARWSGCGTICVSRAPKWCGSAGHRSFASAMDFKFHLRQACRSATSSTTSAVKEKTTLPTPTRPIARSLCHAAAAVLDAEAAGTMVHHHRLLEGVGEMLPHHHSRWVTAGPPFQRRQVDGAQQMALPHHLPLR